MSIYFIFGDNVKWYYAGAMRVKADKVGFMADIWERCQAITKTAVKVTLPGPMTVTNSTVRR